MTDAGYCTALGLIAPPQLADFSRRPGITLFQLLVNTGTAIMCSSSSKELHHGWFRV